MFFLADRGLGFYYIIYTVLQCDLPPVEMIQHNNIVNLGSKCCFFEIFPTFCVNPKLTNTAWSFSGINFCLCRPLLALIENIKFVLLYIWKLFQHSSTFLVSFLKGQCHENLVLTETVGF